MKRRALASFLILIFAATATAKPQPPNPAQVQASLGGVSNPGIASSFADQEVPTGAINGSNGTFTLAHTPNPTSSATCVLNGLPQLQGASADLTISGATITYNVAPSTGDRLWCSYRF